jgi:hypothetical protein
MSAPAPSAHGASHEDHEPQPVGLDPDEPHTPYWLTALGGALFLAATVFLLATAGEDVDASAEGAPAAREAAPAPPSEE